jgi:hypothetical protein
LEIVEIVGKVEAAQQVLNGSVVSIPASGEDLALLVTGKVRVVTIGVIVVDALGQHPACSLDLANQLDHLRFVFHNNLQRLKRDFRTGLAAIVLTLANREPEPLHHILEIRERRTEPLPTVLAKGSEDVGNRLATVAGDEVAEDFVAEGIE